jgi:hypothetical protein
LEVDGETYVLDPTQGFLGRRSNIRPGHHIPVVGMPNVLRKLREYIARTGDGSINRYYEYMLAIAWRGEDRLGER